MIRPLILFTLLSFFCLIASAQVVLEGNYLGENIYIQNPRSGDSYCTQKVVVNGKVVSFANTDGYEIMLDSLGYKPGDTLRIEIFHLDDCKPKVLNYGKCLSLPSLDVIAITADSTGVLKWQTMKETGASYFIIETFKWDRWVKIGEAEAKGGAGINSYSFIFKPHSGENKLRLRQVSSSGISHVSKPATYASSIKPVTVKSYRIVKTVELSDETAYQVYDSTGNIIIKGTGKTIDLSAFPRGNYYLLFDNQAADIVKY
jgi:hypothetical protein